MIFYKTICSYFFSLTIALITLQCSSDKENNCTPDPGIIVESFMDIDSNLYHGVKIGNQIWMQENLKTTRYRNGDSIPNIIDNLEWAFLKKGAYCHYGNNNNNNIYGNLYNWYAVSDLRNLAPIGWHVPVDTEFQRLITYLGGHKVAADKLKECGIDHWQLPNSHATNESGFTALPGGLRIGGKFFEIGLTGTWWTISELDTSWSRTLYLPSNSNLGTAGTISTKDQGLSVRCIKD